MTAQALHWGRRGLPSGPHAVWESKPRHASQAAGRGFRTSADGLDKGQADGGRKGSERSDTLRVGCLQDT